ncbi:MAG: hypothetical protein B0W54_18735 [Cellvibrio sp. 79]|nr:MAG: hypothetical protein B0W54_18735 [Cellvibrio sp. 79]
MKYYKCYTESHEGMEGHFFCEVDNGIITRQINAFGDNLYWATPEAENNEEYFYTDQPEFEPTDSDLEITEEEFKKLWDKANAL